MSILETSTVLRTPFFRQAGIPVNSVRNLSTPESARSLPKGDIILEPDQQTGLIRNTAFDPSHVVYGQDYEATQAYSAVFNRFHIRLADDLIARCNLRGKRLVEIGCGTGEFLALRWAHMIAGIGWIFRVEL